MYMRGKTMWYFAKKPTAPYIAVLNRRCSVYQGDSPDHGVKGKQNYKNQTRKKPVGLDEYF
jgi:hypothetical protein